MSVGIQIDNQPAFYTNLDIISGNIILNVTSDENVSAIVVKLEGESKTMLMMRPDMMHGRRSQRQAMMASEDHKVLYRAQQVFPPPSASSGGTYLMPRGQYKYPFRFKIPFNNGCCEPQNMGMAPGFGSMGLLQQMQYRHVKQTLPPSLTALPDQAHIQYYLKVTVQRPSLFKENRRSLIGFRFMPTQPPRTPPTGAEVFARRPYVFQAGLAPYAKKSAMFKKNATALSDEAPKGEVDAKLPSPAILTYKEPLPLRLTLKNTNTSAEQLFLVTLQISLIGYTEVRCQDLVSVETGNWILLNLTGLDMPIGKPDDPVGTETTVPRSLWNQITLPNSMAPSFVTCNITRRYEFEVRVGLGFGHPGQIQVSLATISSQYRISSNPPH